MAIPELLDSSLRLTDAIFYGLTTTGSTVPQSRTIATTPPLTGGGDLSANRTLGITLTGGGSGAVGTGRTIATTAPLTGGGTLASDLTLALTTSPVGQTPVGVTRSLAGTSPIRIDGGASADLSANRTISVLPFTGAVDGIVTHNPSGVQGKFLKDDNTWGNSAVAGVSDITVNAPLTASASTGSVDLDIAVVSLLENGVAPAIGTATGTKCLTDTNPPTWQTPGLTGFVRLQGSTPGTADVGNAHIDGTMIAEDAITAGHTQTLGLGLVEAVGSGSLDALVGRVANTSNSPLLRLYRARGTIASPSVTQNNDTIGGFIASGYNTNTGYTGNLSSGVLVKADGNAAATEQPTYMDAVAGSIGANTYARLSSAGLLVVPGTPGNSVRALSTFEVSGSFGLKATAKTSNFTVGSSDTSYFVDATAGNVTITLVNANTCAGRIYAFERVDITSNAVAFSGTIQGVASFQLSQGETLVIQSDGSNWFRRSFKPEIPYTKMNVVASSAVSGTTTKTSFDQNVALLRHQRPYNTSAPVMARITASGVYSTHGSGTNNVTLYLRDTSTPQDIAATRTITLTNGLSNDPWYMDITIYLNSPSNILVMQGLAQFYDASGDKASVMLASTPLYTAANTYNIACGVQWSNTNAGNSIEQRRLLMNVFEQLTF